MGNSARGRKRVSGGRVIRRSEGGGRDGREQSMDGGGGGGGGRKKRREREREGERRRTARTVPALVLEEDSGEGVTRSCMEARQWTLVKEERSGRGENAPFPRRMKSSESSLDRRSGTVASCC